MQACASARRLLLPGRSVNQLVAGDAANPADQIYLKFCARDRTCDAILHILYV